MSLLDADPIYKPFKYPWAYDAWLTQQRIHWLPEEIPLADDVKDWQRNLTPVEKNLLTQIFRFFTQADVEVNNCYMRHYARIFKPTEVQMMLAAFSNMETIHVAAYSHLLDTVGMPESEYSAFLKYKEMKDKYDYMHDILMNFPRHNKMKGMGQVVTWSVRDESLHTQSIIKLFHTFLAENPEVKGETLERELYKACETIVTHEDAFIDLAFELGDLEGLKGSEVKAYIRYIADRRLAQLGLQPIYNSNDKNPLPWMDAILNGMEHTNFFENRSTEYSRAATRGSWEEAFD